MPRVVDEAEAGSEVELTRRGKPVAVVISVDEYQRLKEQRLSFGEAYAKFREAYPEGAEGVELGSEYFRKLREQSEGRDVEL